MLLIISPKFVYATRRLKQECARASLEAHFFDVQELAEKNFEIDIEKYSCLYVRQAWPYFQEVVSLAQRFAQAGKRVVDRNMEEGDIDVSKWTMHEKLLTAHLPVPQTQLLSESSLPFPYILKWAYGFGGKQVYLIESESELNPVLAKYPKEELIVQEFIQAKYEYKVITVGYKALSSILCFETDNLTYKPRLNKFEILLADSDRVKKVTDLAERAAKALGRELAKVDILEDFEKNLFVLEVNRQPGFQAFEKLSGYNIAKEFVNYLK